MRYSVVGNWKIHIGLLNLSKDWFWDILRRFKTLQKDQNNLWIYLTLSETEADAIRFLCEVFTVSYLPLVFDVKFSFVILFFIYCILVDKQVKKYPYADFLSFTLINYSSLTWHNLFLYKHLHHFCCHKTVLLWLYSFLFCPMSSVIRIKCSWA